MVVDNISRTQSVFSNISQDYCILLQDKILHLLSIVSLRSLSLVSIELLDHWINKGIHLGNDFQVQLLHEDLLTSIVAQGQCLSLGAALVGLRSLIGALSWVILLNCKS